MGGGNLRGWLFLRYSPFVYAPYVILKNKKLRNSKVKLNKIRSGGGGGGLNGDICSLGNFVVL